MAEHLPQLIDRDQPVFTISVAASLADMHPQTLRTYDRLGLVVPQRTKGRGRRYSPRDVARLRLIQRLSQDEGINLNGIRHIIDLQSQLDTAQERIEQLTDAVRQMAAERAQTSRVFTAASSGAVYHGRTRVHLPRALASAG